MSQAPSAERIREILETDPIWSAYALADLDPKFSEFSQWLVIQDSLVLLYHGLDPPVLFALGHPDQLKELFLLIPAGKFTYTLSGYSRELIKPRLHPQIEYRMWRMALKLDEFPGRQSQAVVKMGLSHLEAIQELIHEQPDQPDSFVPMQVETGPFYGYYVDDVLVSMAGVHILSHWASVAAIGNVFTLPEHRGEGFATAVTAAVIEDLISQGIGSIVLNVGMDNLAAIACYRNLGFWPYCGYYEGTGMISN
jgi:ribosomal protein S18 acetylase RimI-like enzyme